MLSGTAAICQHAGMNALSCRPGCAACCTAPSISSPIPGMPDGKPAGVACVQLDAQGLCRLFGQPERPAVCVGLQPAADMCGESREQAMIWLAALEQATSPVLATTVSADPVSKARTIATTAV